ncbi:MAG: hypothetical protein SCALA702_22290 [Melioribacteraceae bacterium]|nr:MAG: hypothetical protein SCALA702_22290 [Melioribacteraceae bacterium]
MTLQDAYNFFENLKIDTTIKSEIKVYERFKYILSELKIRKFSKDEIRSIETKLESLDLKSNPENRKKFFNKALTKFEEYLKNTFSLISKDYYTKLYGGLGLSFGLLFGVVFLSSWERSLGISLGLIIGMVIGATAGQSMDSKAKTESRVL